MTTPLTKREIATQKRRTSILDAATACFVEKGFHQTGMREIAKRADVSLGNLYNHFSSKHALLVGLANQEMAEIQPFVTQLQRDMPPCDGLKEFVQSYLICCSNRDAAILYLDISAEAMRQPDIASRFVNARNSLAEALSSVISRGVQMKSFRPVLDNLAMAHLILDLIESSAARGVIDRIDAQTLTSNVEAFVFAALSD